MRLVQVAKALGMTGQQLRHELEQVNFGVKPTDREVSDTLAQGIIRFIARKHGKEVDMEALQGMSMGDEEVQKKAPEVPAAAETPAPEAGHAEQDGANKSVNVLRKLTLDDVSREAIAREANALQQRRPAAHKRRPFDKRKRSTFEKRDIASSHQEQIKKKEGTVFLPAHITVKELAEKAGIQVPMLVQTLMKNGVLATIT
ncbi:MAG: hypothetical protein PHX93_03550, partial [Candidatus Peribacteraceae bacterium]|nr:hypothetical protein [Candidatus Peribacteraceae bacterium]